LKTGLACLALAIFVVTLIACGDDDDSSGPTPCDQKTQIIEDATAGFCAGKETLCCLCQCWQESPTLYNYDAELFAGDGTCQCLPPPEPPPEPPCEDAVLEAANTCIADETACTADLLAEMELWCEASIF
jgi:hypothetical protein